jgi:predicted RNase H-like nuclease (RuvC/YqgF family)
MDTWWNNFKVRCEINATTSQLRTLQRTIELLEGDIEDTKDRIVAYKAKMAQLDGNQRDLFIQERP